MDQIEPRILRDVAQREGGAEYLLDMIGQLAKLARDHQEIPIAIHLEAIIAARRATSQDRSA